MDGHNLHSTPKVKGINVSNLDPRILLEKERLTHTKDLKEVQIWS